MKIELLAPARDVKIGRSAVLSGADALYIGGPSFGARAAAGNTMEEIEELVKFAHGFGARVYLTMNTILFEEELDVARRQAEEAWRAGVDALIVQDMAYLEMDLPPIELHSSTQMFNMSSAKVKFMEEVGFARVVLERALTVSEIIDIRRETNVELEAFVHGAICVGYSGQCYLSQALCGRGGNRGACAQSCRSKYDLYRKNGELLAKNKQVLSVGDLNLSDRLTELIDAGVCSLKIEGRLKDESYVVNNVSYYSDILDRLGVDRVAQGRVSRKFVPNPSKSFSRPMTRYFFDDCQAKVGTVSRSLGEYIGKVKEVRGSRVVLESKEVLNNGDGLCWVLSDGEVMGSNVNVVEDGFVELNGSLPLIGMEVYRNFDRNFKASGEDVERKIEVTVRFGDGEVVVSDGVIEVRKDFDMNAFDRAANVELARKNIMTTMSKVGGTVFEVRSVEVDFEASVPFVPMSVLNLWRRELLYDLWRRRVEGYKRRERVCVTGDVNIDQRADYRLNVSNSLSQRFYARHGLSVDDAMEVTGSVKGQEVLRSRFCLRRELGLCAKVGVYERSEPLILENNGRLLEAFFHCDKCEMSLVFIDSL